ncbi:MAG: hypothetical protein JWR36_1943 [Glaciihabitans sp.]|jgi:heat shock protein HslJ|nr:hypothetical protein [Glaciihabitans sp.]MDQ1571421.1 hypothetical protein [Actinomycetota bacterium]
MRAPSALTVGFIAAVSASILLAGCASRGNSTPDPRLDGQWQLASASDDNGTLELGDARVTLTIGDDRHTGGLSPCTEYTASITGSAGVVFVRASSDGVSACPDRALGALEVRYIDVLNATHFAVIGTNSLVLSSAHGTLSYVKGTNPKPAPLESTTWVLESLSSSRVNGLTWFVPDAVSVRFSKQNNFLLTGACSTISAVYSSADRRISVTALSEDIGDGGSCNEANAAVGQQISHLLGGAFTLDIDGNALFVTSVDTGESAVFRARTS